jgi:transmembrane sensor
MTRKELFIKFAHNKASASETAELRRQLQGLPADELSDLMDEFAEILGEVNDFGEADETQFNEMMERIREWNQVDAKPVRKILPVKRWIAAASVFLILGAGLLWIINKQKNDNNISYVASAIKPGKDGAVLTLADGRQLVLDSSENGLLAVEKGSVLVLENGQLKYEETTEKEHSVELVYNTMTTPRGRQFQIELPDGTKVWLNAASSIRFPTRFNGKERRVEITGEAFFEVAKDSTKAFIALVNNNVEVRVLGTHFNINGYSDEPLTKTTLVEGKVAVNALNQEPAILKPGQQAMIDASSNMFVTEVNVDEVVSWKNGRFIFQNSDIQTLMRQVARWYDIEVVFEGNISELFVAEVSRHEPLSELLKLLELTKMVHFQLEGNKVIVKEGAR